MSKMFLQYRLVSQLAAKPSCHVYLAHPVSAPTDQVVIKRFHGKRLTSQEEQASFLTEAQALKDLHHPHILPLLEIGVENEHPYMVSAYARNSWLNIYLKRSFPLDLPVQEALDIVSQVGQALAAAHERGILHGSLKPEDILFNLNGEALLTDFMLTSLTDVKSPEYKPDAHSMCYMAPESFAGQRSKESDQYALGCLAYELLTERVPFSALAFSTMHLKHKTEPPVPLSNFVHDLPAHVEDAVLKALAKEPAQRHASVAAFIATLAPAPTQRSLGTSGSSLLSPLPLAAEQLPLAEQQLPGQAAEQMVPLVMVTTPVISDQTTGRIEVVQVSANIDDLSDGRGAIGSVRSILPSALPLIQAPLGGKGRVTRRKVWATLAVACMLIVSAVLVPHLFAPANTRMPDNKLVTLLPTTSASTATATSVQGTPTLQATASPLATAVVQKLTAQSTPTSGPSSTSPTALPTASSAPTAAPTPLNQAPTTLNGSFAPVSNDVDLTGEGTIDWVHWGFNSANEVDRKAGVAQKISTFALIGTSSVNTYWFNPSGFSWSDGTPTGSASTQTGVCVTGVNNGFSIRVPASSTTRTLRIYVGAFQAQGQITVSLNGSTYTDTSVSDRHFISSGVYTIVFASGSGQSLTVTYTLLNAWRGGANVSLLAATLR